MLIIKIIFPGVGVSSSAAILFYIVTVIAGFLLRNLAQKWPKLIQIWDEKEYIFLKAPYSAPKYNPTVLMTTVAILIFMIVFVEHIFYHIKSYQETLLNLKKCNLSETKDVLHHLYQRERVHIADVVPYTIWLQPLLEWQNFAFALSWSYIDVIIVNISIGITTRFKQLNNRVNGIRTLVRDIGPVDQILTTGFLTEFNGGTVVVPEEAIWSIDRSGTRSKQSHIEPHPAFVWEQPLFHCRQYFQRFHVKFLNF